MAVRAHGLVEHAHAVRAAHAALAALAAHTIHAAHAAPFLADLLLEVHVGLQTGARGCGGAEGVREMQRGCGRCRGEFWLDGVATSAAWGCVGPRALKSEYKEKSTCSDSVSEA